MTSPDNNMDATAAEPLARPRPSPLPYQRRIVQFLKAEEPGLWKWFSNSRFRAEHADAVRLDLLKSTYRIEPNDQPGLYAVADEVLSVYGLRANVTIYQAQTAAGMNAALAYVANEVHLVLVGPVLTVLSEAEQKALVGHELAHFLLYHEWDGDFLIAADLLRALSNDAGAAPAHQETARLFNLYTEVFADRGSYCICGDARAAITTLLKAETGLAEVSADSYLRQAEEIFKKSQVQADQLTHPELYIRARALMLWAERGDDAFAEIERMIEGCPALVRLDLLGQRKVADTTRRLVSHLLAPPWFQSEAAMAHARLYFEDFTVGDRDIDAQILGEEVQASDSALQDYFCYVLLDFVAVDRDLGDVALAAGLALSKNLGVGERFVELALKELAIPKKQFAKIQKDADKIMAKATEASTTP